MRTEMRTDQVFRVKGLAGRTDNMEIKLTVLYREAPAAVHTVDLAGRRCEAQGLSVVVGADELDIGRSFRSAVTGFSLDISDRAYSVEQLSLRYAVCGAAELMKSDFCPEYKRLSCGHTVFTLENDRFIVEMADGAEIGADKRREAACAYEDVIGNIRADISIISRFPNSKEREELENALHELLLEAESGGRTAREIDKDVRGREKQVLEYINSSADYFKGSGKHLLEKTAARGR